VHVKVLLPAQSLEQIAPCNRLVQPLPVRLCLGLQFQIFRQRSKPLLTASELLLRGERRHHSLSSVTVLLLVALQEALNSPPRFLVELERVLQVVSLLVRQSQTVEFGLESLVLGQE